MRFHWWTFVLQTTNFLVLVWLLRRFLWRPLLAAVDRRRQQSERALADAEAARKAATASAQLLLRERESMGGERDALLSKAQLDAEAARRQLLARAEAEATAALTAARADIAHERVEAMRELRERAASLGVALARRLLEAAEADGVTPHLLDEALAALPTLNDGDHIEIVSARPLTPGERDHCLERLHGADVRFAVDPLLIAGVELHFGSSILHHSWRDALADAERALAGDGDAR